jgi:hypothetical protein
MYWWYGTKYPAHSQSFATLKLFLFVRIGTDELFASVSLHLLSWYQWQSGYNTASACDWIVESIAGFAMEKNVVYACVAITSAIIAQSNGLESICRPAITKCDLQRLLLVW